MVCKIFGIGTVVTTSTVLISLLIDPSPEMDVTIKQGMLMGAAIVQAILSVASILYERLR